MFFAFVCSVCFAGIFSSRVFVFLAANCFVFILTSYLLNLLTSAFSSVALLFLLGALKFEKSIRFYKSEQKNPWNGVKCRGKSRIANSAKIKRYVKSGEVNVIILRGKRWKGQEARLMNSSKRLKMVFILFFVLGLVVFSQEKQGVEDKDKGLREEILAVYQSGGEQGLRDFFKQKGKEINGKFIVDFAEAGVKERKQEWLKACEILAEEKKDEKTLADIYFKFGDYFRLVSSFEKANYYFEMALKLYERLNDNIGKGNVYLCRGDIFQITKIKSSAIEMYENAMIYFTKAKYSLGKGNIYLRLGNIHLNSSEYSKALDMYERSLAFFEEIGDHNGKGKVCQSKGDIYFYLDNKSEALEMYDKALSFFEKTGDLLDLGNLYMRKGIIVSKSSDRKQAIEMYDKALYFFKKANNILGEGNVYSYKGDILFYSGDNVNAIEMYETALTFFKKIGDILGQGNAFLRMGLIYFYTEDYKRSMEMFKKSLTYFEKSGNQIGIGNAYQKMGEIYFMTGDNSAAMEMYNKAMPFVEKAKNPINHGNLYLNIGDIYFRIGEYSNANRIYDEAVSYFEKSGGSPSLGTAFFLKGDIYYYSGNNIKALEMYEKGLKIFDNAKIPLGLGNGYFRKGDVYLRTGTYSVAIGMYNKALPFFEQTKSLTGQGNVYWRKGDIFYYTGDNTNALEMYEKALLFFEKAGLPLGQGDIYRRKGDIYSITRDSNNAFKMYDKALIYFEKSGELRGKVNIFYGKGEIYFNSGFSLKALEMYDKALIINKQIEDIESDAYILYKKAKVFERFKKKLEADDLFEGAISKLEKLREQTVFMEMKSTLMEKFYKIYEEAVVFMLQNKYYEKAFTYAESMRARVFLDQMAEALVPLDKGLNSPLKEDRDLLVGKLSALSRQMQETPGNEEKKSQELKEEYRKVESQFDDLLIKIRLENPLYASVNYPQPISVQDLQKDILNDGETLLSYFISQDESYAFVISKNNFKVELLKLKEKELNGFIERYLTAIKENNSNDMKRYGSLLYEKLFKPMEKYLEKTNDIIIVPAGQLETIPFESLIAEKKNPGSPVYLLGKYRLKYIQNATLLSILRKHYARENTSQGFIGFGDPVYDYENFKQGKPEQGSATKAPRHQELFYNNIFGVPLCLSAFVAVSNTTEKEEDAVDEIKEIHRDRFARAGGLMDRLPQSGQEVQAIAQLFQKESLNNVVHLRDQATEDNAKTNNMKDFAYIHFSCHGLLNDDFQCLVLSQLPPDKSKEDGYFTLNEIMNCSYNARLVVLSACETGSGKMIKGEGVTGLTRAVMYAGTPAVVASLWKVDDVASKELMIAFYKNMLEKNLDKTEALRQAKLELLKNGKYSSPLFWSAFVMYGE